MWRQRKEGGPTPAVEARVYEAYEQPMEHESFRSLSVEYAVDVVRRMSLRCCVSCACA